MSWCDKQQWDKWQTKTVALDLLELQGLQQDRQVVGCHVTSDRAQQTMNSIEVCLCAALPEKMDAGTIWKKSFPLSKHEHTEAIQQHKFYARKHKNHLQLSDRADQPKNETDFLILLQKPKCCFLEQEVWRFQEQLTTVTESGNVHVWSWFFFILDNWDKQIVAMRV